MISDHVVFDIIAWLSALLTTWLMYRWRFRIRVDDLAQQLNAGYFIALSAGGLIGAHVFGTWNAVLSGQPGIGRSILGGLLGAIAFVELYKLRRNIRGSTGPVFAVPFALAVAIGRIGCFQSGLDDFTYGTPTDLPWGADFGDGLLRHPVQIYEALTMAAVALLLLAGFWRRSPWLLANGFYLTAGTYALQRFAWEFLKPYGPVIGSLNLFHVLCLILIAYAIGMVYLGLGETA